jgi:hypothetical protein
MKQKTNSLFDMLEPPQQELTPNNDMEKDKDKDKDSLTKTPCNNNSSTFSSSGTPLRLYLTDETRYTDSSHTIPDALIDLSQIEMGTFAKPSNIQSQPQLSSSLPNAAANVMANQLSLNLNSPYKKTSMMGSSDYTPRHSLLCSPKKADVDVVIVEELTEDYTNDEDRESEVDADADTSSDGAFIPFHYNSILMNKNLNNSLTSISKPSNNSSTNSLTQQLQAQASTQAPVQTQSQVTTPTLSSTPAYQPVHNPFTSMNTSSISSLKGRVRYQSYYSLAPSTPKSNYSYNYNYNSNVANVQAHSRSNSQHRLSHSLSLSPIKPTPPPLPEVKSPFQYQSLQYDLPEDFHELNRAFSENDDTTTTAIASGATANNRAEKENSPTPGSCPVSSSGTGTGNASASALPSTQRQVPKILYNNETTPAQKPPPVSAPACTPTSGNKSRRGSSTSKHERSSSLFSLLSRKIHNHNHNHNHSENQAHHRRKSSQFSSASIIEQQTNDDLLGLNINSLSVAETTIKNDTDNDNDTENDDTFNASTTASTAAYLGEPGPMVDSTRNVHLNLGQQELNNIRHMSPELPASAPAPSRTSRSRPAHSRSRSTQSSRSTISSASTTTSSLKQSTNIHANANANTSSSSSSVAPSKKGLFGWIVKSKKRRDDIDNRTHTNNAHV